MEACCNVNLSLTKSVLPLFLPNKPENNLNYFKMAIFLYNSE